MLNLKVYFGWKKPIARAIVGSKIIAAIEIKNNFFIVSLFISKTI